MPHTYRIRSARADEAAVVTALLNTAVGEFPPHAIRPLVDGTAGEGLRRCAASGGAAMIRHVRDVARAPGGLLNVLASQSVFLVAADEAGRIGGALHMLPPGRLLAGLAERGHPLARVMDGMVSVVRVDAVAVDPEARANGLGGALLERGLQLYRHAGYAVVYGSYHESSALAPFYEKCGFDVLAKDRLLALEPVLGTPVNVGPGPGEVVFTRWLRDPSAPMTG